MAETGTKDRASDQAAKTAQSALDVPVQQLKDAGREVVKALMVQTLEKATGRIEGLAHRLNDAADGAGAGTKAAAAGAEALAEGKSPLKAGVGAGMAGVKEKAKQVVGAGGGDGDGGDKTKVTTIIEQFDVGLPRRVAYDQWTRFTDYPSFTKKVESVEQESDEKLNWRAQIFLSHRTWESTIIEQVPDERIAWKSKAPHGYVDGSVTFHELAPTLTRILLVAEYHPDGFFEKTANLWRAQGRRLRADFKHIKRHMMTQTLLQQDEVEGWRGEIRDGEVVKSHEDALKEEEGEKEETEEKSEKDQPDEKDEKDQQDQQEQPEQQDQEKAESE
ncbi:SRPBCC family protein [Actinomadura chibensis]|uniref:SRPBCC family protein n=1 Tax=Actinomadura chibensis TaxID=392828 RepID=UPI000835FAD0|nr:SRPBCC family protein [Actinomadura chibensis]